MCFTLCRLASSYGSSGNKAGEKITLNVSRSPTRVRDQIVHHDSPVSSEERSRKDRFKFSNISNCLSVSLEGLN